MVGFKLIGLKPYYVTCDEIYNWKDTNLPVDGMVYFPILLTSFYNNTNRKINQFYQKLFVSSDMVYSSLVDMLKRGDKFYYYGQLILEEGLPNKQNSVDSPLLYEVIHLPPGIMDKNGSYFISDIRVEKDKYEKICKETPIIEAGNVCGYTAFFSRYSGIDLLKFYISKMSPSRSVIKKMCMIQSDVSFCSSFILHFKKSLVGEFLDGNWHVFSTVNKSKEKGKFVSSANDFVNAIMSFNDYETAIMVIYYLMNRRLCTFVNDFKNGRIICTLYMTYE
jgi:hypothetical protein